MSEGPFSTKAPWWARFVGYWRRRRWERADRAEKLAARARLNFVGSIVGQTNWHSEKPWTQNTHRWDFYESETGKRSVIFIRMGGTERRKKEKGEDHVLHASVVTPWLHNKWDMAWDKTVEKGNAPWGWRR